MDRRKLKVYRRANERGKEIPMIILQGNWLEKYGLKPGDYIAVDCEKNSLNNVPREPDPSERKSLAERIDHLTPAQKKKVAAVLDKLGL